MLLTLTLNVSHLQNVQFQYSFVLHSPSQLALHIYRCDGVRGLYTGFVGVFTKMVLGFAAMFGTYDLFRSHFVREGQTKDQIGQLTATV